MNIFILDTDPVKSANYHTDKHCVKMILEHAQMLCTAMFINPELQRILNITDIPYKKTHIGHPCTVWVAKNYDNFSWLIFYTHVLHDEYSYRYGREHLSYKTLKNYQIITENIINNGKILNIVDLNPPSVMPDECKVDSVIESYRNYYRQYKTQLFHWTKRLKPYWLE